MESNRTNTWLIVGVLAVAAFLCLLAVGVVAWGAATGRFDWRELGRTAEEQVERSFELGETPSVEIDNFAGAVTVQAASRQDVQVTAIKHAGNRSRLAEIEIEMTEQAGALLIETRRPAGLLNAWVELKVLAPVGTHLVAHTGSGSMEVTGLKAEVTAESGSGSVTVRDVEGALRAETGSGGIEVSGVIGPVVAETGSGGIDITDVTGDLRAHTGSGSIDIVDVEGPVRLDTGSGSIEYRGVPEGECRFETGSGSISLYLPAGLGAGLDLSTGTGRVDVEQRVEGDVSRRKVMGTIGDGSGASIYAHTGSGDIEVERR